MNRKFGLIACVILLLTLSACSPTKTHELIPTFYEVESDLLTGIDVDTIFSTIEHLSKEPRVAGTESERNAAEFLTNQLEQFGYTVKKQTFEFERYVYPQSSNILVDGFNGSLTPVPFQYTVSGIVSGGLVDANKGRPDDYKNIDVSGKIALVAASNIYFYELVLNAAKSGAKAVIIYSQEDSPTNIWSLKENNEHYIPALALSHEEGSALLDFINSERNVTTTVSIKGSRMENVKSQNIIATKHTDITENNSDIVIIGAHYDSVDEAPGASDNASGTAVVLELARVFKDIQTDKEIRFLLFGAEEEGLIGSEHYVNSMSNEEIKRSIAMFNLDMVGSSDAGSLSIQTVDGTPNKVTNLASQANEELNGEKLWVEFGDRSDHMPFDKVGIDAALFIHFPSEDWYHTTEDTIEKISKDRLLNVTKIVAKSTFELTFFR